MYAIRFQYGSGVRSVPLRERISYDCLAPYPFSPLSDPESVIRFALAHPIGRPPIQELVRPGERVAILVNDITRLVRSEVFLPVLIDELNVAGIPDRDIFIVFALGIHRQQTPKEQRRIVGEQIAQRIALYDHDCYNQKNLVHLGRTSRGNEVWINRQVREADRVILTGEIIYHLIAGYSGGRKSLVPGVAGAATTTFNHRFILDAQCQPGVLEGNPAHEDLLEACRMFDSDFLLNVVLNPAGELVHIVAGHYDFAHRAGCKVVDQMYRVEIAERYDVVLASAGGFPFDIDLRQAHKGMQNAARALRPGGTLIYFAECRDGVGHPAFEEWMNTYSTSEQMETELRSRFVVGGHKAYWVKYLGEHLQIHLVSSLPDSFVRKCDLQPVQNVEHLVARTLTGFGSQARVAYMPHAGSCLPVVAQEHMRFA